MKVVYKYESENFGEFTHEQIIRIINDIDTLKDVKVWERNTGKLFLSATTYLYSNHPQNNFTDTVTYDKNENKILITTHKTHTDGKYYISGYVKKMFSPENKEIWSENMNRKTLYSLFYGSKSINIATDENSGYENYLYDTVAKTWVPSSKNVFINVKNYRAWHVLVNYIWDFSSDNWKLAYASYLRYDSVRNFEETGTYKENNMDSFWSERKYYSIKEPVYKPLDGDISFVLSPNPSAGKVSAHIYSTDPDELHLVMIDMFGRFVFEKKLYVSTGLSKVEILENNQLRSGMYIYYVSSKNYPQARQGKLVVTQ